MFLSRFGNIWIECTCIYTSDWSRSCRATITFFRLLNFDCIVFSLSRLCTPYMCPSSTAQAQLYVAARDCGRSGTYRFARGAAGEVTGGDRYVFFCFLFCLALLSSFLLLPLLVSNYPLDTVGRTEWGQRKRKWYRAQGKIFGYCVFLCC